MSGVSRFNDVNGAQRLNNWNVRNSLLYWCVMCQIWPGKKWRFARGIVFFRSRFLPTESRF
jgi:hypothetical protein